MDQRRFDVLTARLAAGLDRRHAILGIIAGTAGSLGFDRLAAAKKRRKKRCKPRRLQEVCQSNKQCCTKKTGRICASNQKTSQCNQNSNVCCLPVGSFGCNDSCDCCGGPDILCDIGPGKCDFI